MAAPWTSRAPSDAAAPSPCACHSPARTQPHHLRKTVHALATQDPPTAPESDTLILVVEDDPQLRTTIELALLDEGFTVETAADGLEAVERVRSHRPALVLLDWGLPLLSGKEVAEAIHTTY